MNGFVHGLVYGTLVAVAFLSAAAVAQWFERKFAGRMQSRLGPTLVGPFGLLQPLADVVKLLQKEEIIADNADRFLFRLAPLLVGVLSLGAAALVPYSPTIAVASLDVGVIYVLAIGAVTSLGVFMAGWASNNKFSLFGAMRALAQSVSYEVPLVLSAMVPVVLASSMNAGKIVEFQNTHHWFVTWPFFLGVPAFAIFFLSSLAEANRIPFDIPEAESELVAGVTTEYTGMSFAMFLLSEYIHTLVASAVAAALFFGGWDGPFAPGAHWMIAKTLTLFVFIYWVRWSLVRFRSDQLMKLCWYVLVPASVFLLLGAGLFVAMGGGQ